MQPSDKKSPTNNSRREIRFEFKSETLGDFELHDIHDAEKNISPQHYINFSTKTAIDEFPSGEFSLNYSEQVANLKRKDSVTVYIKTERDREFVCLFYGFINELSINIDNQPTIPVRIVSIKAISHFFLLGSMSIDAKKLPSNGSARNLIRDLVNISGIPYKSLVLEGDFEDEFNIDVISNISILSLIKFICFTRDCVCEFSREGNIRIIDRELVMSPRGMGAPMITLTDDDIITAEFNTGRFS